MNRISITACALCMSLAASAQVNYTIKGTATGMDGQTVYLNDAENSQTNAMDSVIISNNAFTFKGTQPKVCFATVSAGRARTTLVLRTELSTSHLIVREKRQERLQMIFSKLAMRGLMRSTANIRH